MSDPLNIEQTHHITIAPENHGLRLDVAITKQVEVLSRSRVKALIESGCLRSSDQIIDDCSITVKQGINYCLIVPCAKETHILPTAIALDIVYEDEVMLVINKQAGLTVHPGNGNHNDTMVNALLSHCGENLSGVGGVMRPGIVHRLDKDTSGLMVVAKNDLAHQSLSNQISTRQLKRIYLALVWGMPIPNIGSINANMGRHPKERTKMAVVTKGGKTAITHYRVMRHFGKNIISQIECKLETGRTHQIRVHMSHHGYSLVGDQLYGTSRAKLLAALPEAAKDKVLNFKRQSLHSVQIGFHHPTTGEFLVFRSEPPADLQKLISELEKI